MKYTYLVLLVLLTACAQKRSPTGGAKDTESPKVVNASPLPMSIEFNSDKIEIEFDEYVRLESVRDQVLISPPLDEDPEISLSNGKTLSIDLRDLQLRDNTTYTINFGEAIVDNNEGNVLEENVYLFSTGSFIDSLELVGTVLKARYDEPCPSCVVMLFPDVADTSIIDHRPYYVAKTNKEGQFYLVNLAQGEYRLFAVEDRNNDLRINESEAFGFSSVLHRPMTSDTLGRTLRISNAASKENKVSFKEWALDGTYLNIAFEDGLPSFGGSAMTSMVFSETLDGREDSIRMWFSPPLEQGSELIFTLEGELDTLTLGRVIDREQSELQCIGELAHREAEAMLYFSSPIVKVDTSKFILMRDSLPLSITLSDDYPSSSAALNADWLEGNYSLTALPGALEDIYGLTNDTLEIALRCKSIESYGVLALNITLPQEGDFILQLLNKKREVLFEKAVQTDDLWTIEYLDPSDYSLYVIEDVDGNGKWTEGNFNEAKQPEPVYFMTNPISVRANWEMEQDVQVNFMPVE